MKRTLPGDRTRDERMAQIMRVDHAGEYGAKRIYAGQMAVLGHTASGPLVAHMAQQEEAHLAFFEQEIRKRGVRPTLLHPFWHVAGYALGAATALIGEKAAMACTAAVEETIDRHYVAQIDELREDEPDLAASLEIFRQEEAGHRDTALAEGAEKAMGYAFLSSAIKLGCRVAINLAERI